MSVALGGTVFDRVLFDADADVLYLHVGDPASAVEFGESPEGHALRIDRHHRLCGVTILGVRDLLDAGQAVVVTASSPLEADRSELEAAVRTGGV